MIRCGLPRRRGHRGGPRAPRRTRGPGPRSASTSLNRRARHRPPPGETPRGCGRRARSRHRAACRGTRARPSWRGCGEAPRVEGGARPAHRRWKRWLPRTFRGARRARPSGERRHSAILQPGGPGTGRQRYAPATFSRRRNHNNEPRHPAGEGVARTIARGAGADWDGAHIAAFASASAPEAGAGRGDAHPPRSRCAGAGGRGRGVGLALPHPPRPVRAADADGRVGPWATRASSFMSRRPTAGRRSSATCATSPIRACPPG